MNSSILDEIKNITQSQQIDISFNLSQLQIVEKFQNEISWSWISLDENLSEEFIEKFQDKVVWDYISANQNLSEKFIEKFQDKVSWGAISAYQRLSEKFIEKFQDRFNWSYISKYQKLSEYFLNKHKLKIRWEFIVENKKIELSPSFLIDLYNNYEYEIFDILKNKPGLRRISKRIEREIPKLFIEYES